MTSADPVQSTFRSARPRRRCARARCLLTVAVAAALHAGAAHALSLGELRLQSHLGQPLRAQMSLAVGAGEQIAPGCVQVRGPGGTAYDARVSLSGTGATLQLQLQGRQPVREPMLDLVVAINCPGTPVVERWFTLLPTPEAVSDQRAAAAPPAVAPGATAGADTPPTAAPAPTARTTAAAPAAQPAATPARTAPTSPLQAGETYRVQPGDTLSTIAQRVQQRPTGSLWAQAEAILAANPDAFVGGNPDRLRAGAVLEIPALGGAPVAAPAPAVAATDTSVPAATPAAGPAGASPTVLQPQLLPVRPSSTVTAAPVLDLSVLAPAQPEAATATDTAVVSGGATAREPGLLRVLGGAMVGAGLMSLAGLLAWTSLRRRREEDGYDDSMSDTVIDAVADRSDVRPTLAPPPSFDPRYRKADSGLEVTYADHRPADTDEFNAAAQDSGQDADDDYGLDLDALFPEAPEPDAALEPALKSDAAPAAAGIGSAVEAGPDAEADAQAVAVPREKPADEPAPGGLAMAAGRSGGDTTVEHHFTGFSETQTMQLLEQDYTSRFEQARKLDDTGQLEATDTLHGLGEEVLQSLTDLRAEVGEADEGDGDLNAATASLSLEDLQLPGAEALSEELTALMPEAAQARPGHGEADTADVDAGDADGPDENEQPPAAAQGGR